MQTIKKLIDFLWPISCLIFLDELCVAQGMGWFDDQLNFDASVSPSVFLIYQGRSFIEKMRGSYLSTLQMYSTDIGSLDARVASDLDPAGRESLNHLSRRVYIC